MNSILDDLEDLIDQLNWKASEHMRSGGWHEERGKGYLEVAFDLKRILEKYEHLKESTELV